MSSVHIDVKYYNNKGGATHSYGEDWDLTEYYCPACGEKFVWRDLSEGDYYTGPIYLCMMCQANFSLPCGAVATDIEKLDTQMLQRVEGIMKWIEAELNY